MDLTAPQPRRRARVIALRCLVGVTLLFLAASSYVEFRYVRRIYTPVTAPQAPIALVFGAGLAPGKTVSPVLAERLDAAIALYRQGKVKHLLLSGDNSDRYHDEPGAMLRYAVARGVPRDALRSDTLGLSTYDSCARALDVFGIDRALLVTQDFHLPRALFLANSLGIDADGVVADDVKTLVAAYELRELFSRTWAIVQVLARPKPKGGRAVPVATSREGLRAPDVDDTTAPPITRR